MRRTAANIGAKINLEHGRPRVLYIDPEDAALSAVAPALRGAFEVWVARDFAQGLEIGSEVGYEADLIIVDIDSHTVLRADSFIAEYRRRSKRELSVIFVGSLRPTLDITRSTRGAIFLPKPIDTVELIRRGQGVTHKQRRARETR
jgi:DNA-binding response OmpR family regulator